VGWLKQLLRRLWARLARRAEKALSRYSEGPEVPVRYAQAVAVFATMNPRATQGDWLAFAVGHAEAAYRAGYLRGVEWKERAPELADPAVGAALAELDERHDWSWVDMAPAEEQLAEMVRTHPELVERMSPEQRAYYADRIGREMGGFKVVLVPTSDPKER
jgi:hypothetical protein